VAETVIGIRGSGPQLRSLIISFRLLEVWASPVRETSKRPALASLRDRNRGLEGASAFGPMGER
jgi:hypothetical protein